MKLGESEFDEVAEQCRELLGYETVAKNGVFVAHIEQGLVGENPESAELRYEPNTDRLRFVHHYLDKEDIDETFLSTTDLYEFVEETEF